MTYTKDISLSDEIHIDGNDVSDAFSDFSLSDVMEQVDVSGFNATGSDEFLSGKRTPQFTGTAFYTPELEAILWPLHDNRDTFTVVWKPNGLADPARESYSLECQLLEWNPTATRGSPRTMQLTFPAATGAGVVFSASS